MILAYHAIFTCYGFWLPNEERGSWSDFVRSWELRAYGPATKTTERRSVAHVPYDRARRKAANQLLTYDPVIFTGVQARAVARGFTTAIVEGNYQLIACSILPRHVHAVILRHSRPCEQIIGHLKARATQQLREEGLHPFERFRDAGGRIPSVWSHRAWKVYLDSLEDVQRCMAYVENNPLKEGKRRQEWGFVKRVGRFENALRKRSR